MRFIIAIITLFILSCDSGNLTILADLPKSLNESSGIALLPNSKLIWSINDSGNKAKVFGFTTSGKIKKELKIKAKNHDWEDLTTDNTGNLYIGDFGNNRNARQNLTILKLPISAIKAANNTEIKPEKITFYYEDQTEFPPKKNALFFDCESFFWHNKYFYLFTKSRSAKAYGKTNLYKIPATIGHHKAQYVSSFKSCDNLHCWITAADISPNGKHMLLLNHQSAWLFSNYSEDNFFDGTVQELPFNHISQKEGVCFKNDNTIYITDEKSHDSDGNLYEFKLKQ